MNTTPKINHDPHRKASRLSRIVILLLGFVFIPAFVFASAPDTTKYALNDPRNPDCPCHKAQQLAEDEYRNSQQQQQVNNDPVNNNPVNNNDVSNNPTSNGTAASAGDAATKTNTSAATSGSAGSQKQYSKLYKFQRKIKKWSRKMNRNLKKRHKGTKGGKIRVADCFH